MALSTNSEMTQTLDAVLEEDKNMVTDVINIIKSLKMCSGWVVNVIPKGYEILGWIQLNDHVIISLDELDLIQQVNRVRITTVGVKLLAANNKCCIRVVVVAHKEPVMVHEETIVRVRKRKLWF